VELYRTRRPLRYPEVSTYPFRSMIARLPGEQKFMGPHLEMVCLLQAAEIERLCQFLEEFKMKYCWDHVGFVKMKE
jgi:hypothetical protein